MKSADYWRQRALKIKNNTLVQSESYEFDMAKRLAQAALEIESVIDEWATKYADEDGTVNTDEARQLLRGTENHKWQNTLDEWERKARAGGYDHELNLEYYRSRVSRLQALEAQLKNVLAGYAKPEQVKMLSVLTNTYEDSYYRTIYNVQEHANKFSADFAQFDTQALQRAVSKPWHGSDFSNRLWGNMTETLPDMLQKSISRGIVLGYNPKRLVNESQVTFRNFKKYQIHRLITTELAHVTENATFEAYRQSSIEKYEYLATLETKTCDACRKLDSKVFAVKDKEEGVNYPVIHAHCRCTTAPWYEELEDEESTRWARDPKTGKGGQVPNQTFDEWFAYQQAVSKNGIIGVATKDGVQISGVSRHVTERMAQREVSVSSIKQALTNPLHVYPDKLSDSGKVGRKYLGKQSTVVINPETGNVVTTYKTQERYAKKYAKNK